MKFFKIIVFCAFAGIFSLACTQTTNVNKSNNDLNVSNKSTVNTNISNTTSASPVDEFASSRDIFQQNCAGCHKQNGEGGNGLYQGKKIKVPSYKSTGAMNASDDKLADYIINGEEGEMPAFKDKLTSEEIKHMVRFIRKEFQGK